MKASPFVASCLVAVSIVAVSARQMHAAINYKRYLAEVDTTDEDLKAWKAAFWNDNKWLPDFPEGRSSEDIDEDLRQRIFMSKQDVLEAQAANPNATFSIMTPFSALTKEEFAAKVLNSYVQGDASPRSDPKGTKRSLRETDTYTISNRQDFVNTLRQNPRGYGRSRNKNKNKKNAAVTRRWHWVRPVAARRPVSVPARKPIRAPSRAPSNRPRRPAAAARAPVHVKPKPVAPPSNRAKPAFRPAAARSSTNRPPIPVQAKKQVARTTNNSLDWSKSRCMTPIQTQGQCGSCWAFAAVAAVESLQCIKSGQVGINKYSEQQVVGCVSRNKGCGGGAAVYAFDYIQQNGLCLAKAHPYTLANGGPKACRASCSKTRTGITGYEKLVAGNEAQLINALKSQPIVASVASGNVAWKQYTGGVLSSCQSTAIDHAVLVVGYDATTFKIRNSWGKNWGEDGYIRLQRTSGLGTCGLLKDMSRPKM